MKSPRSLLVLLLAVRAAAQSDRSDRLCNADDYADICDCAYYQSVNCKNYYYANGEGGSYKPKNFQWDTQCAKCCCETAKEYPRTPPPTNAPPTEGPTPTPPTPTPIEVKERTPAPTLVQSVAPTPGGTWWNGPSGWGGGGGGGAKPKPKPKPKPVLSKPKPKPKVEAIKPKPKPKPKPVKPSGGGSNWEGAPSWVSTPSGWGTYPPSGTQAPNTPPSPVRQPSPVGVPQRIPTTYPTRSIPTKSDPTTSPPVPPRPSPTPPKPTKPSYYKYHGEGDSYKQKGSYASIGGMMQSIKAYMMIGAAFIVVALIGFFVGMAHEDRRSRRARIEMGSQTRYVMT